MRRLRLLIDLNDSQTNLTSPRLVSCFYSTLKWKSTDLWQVVVSPPARTLEFNKSRLFITDSGKINEAALWICVEQLHRDFFAQAKTLLSAHNASINRRLNQARKDSLG